MITNKGKFLPQFVYEVTRHMLIVSIGLIKKISKPPATMFIFFDNQIL